MIPPAKSVSAMTPLLSLHMDLHLIDCVVEVAAGIPNRAGWLNASLIVGCAGQDCEFTSARRLPLVGEQAPGVARVVFAECGCMPRRPAIGGNLDFRDFGLSCPRDTFDVECASALR